jgi:hypothetical protein
MDDYEQWCNHVEAIKAMVGGLGLETVKDDEGDYEGPTGKIDIFVRGKLIGELNWHPWWGPAAEWSATSEGRWCSRDSDSPQRALKELLARHAQTQSGEAKPVKKKAPKNKKATSAKPKSSASSRMPKRKGTPRKNANYGRVRAAYGGWTEE